MATKFAKQSDIAVRNTPSTSFPWGLLQGLPDGASFYSMGFFRTESAAKQFALFASSDCVYIIGKVMTRTMIRGSRGV